MFPSNFGSPSKSVGKYPLLYADICQESTFSFCCFPHLLQRSKSDTGHNKLSTSYSYKFSGKTSSLNLCLKSKFKLKRWTNFQGNYQALDTVYTSYVYYIYD